MAGAGIMSLRLPPATGGPACTVRCGARTRAVRSHRVVQGARVGAHQPTRGPNQLKWELRARTRAVSVTSAVPEPGPEEVELEDMGSSIDDVVPDIESIDESLPPSRSCIESEAFLAHDGDDIAHGDEAAEWEAALLITGTAVGGGSLALPYFCAAGGFIPAVGLLAISWVALLGSAVTLVEPTIRVWEDNPAVAVSIHTVVETYLGKLAGVAAGITFWILINCTLVSQLAKCGELAALSIGAGAGAAWWWATRLGTLATAVLIAGAAFRRDVGRINALATTGLFASFAAACVVGSAGISTGMLAKVNVLMAVPALPAIMQTMTYAEAIPTVVDMCRGSRKKIRRVLAIGSAGPALMYVLWLAVTLGRKELAAFSASGGDLAAKILADGGLLGAATGSIAVCASISTLIGCYLALSRFNADTFHLPLNKGCKKLLALTVLPSLVLAMKGPELYYLMIKFAGTVPVAFLWGVLPPLVMWKQFSGDQKLGNGLRALLAAGVAISLAAMGYGIMGFDM